jgi:type V secretory pathway adhesin AidA
VIENFLQTSFESVNIGKGIGIYSGSVLLTSWFKNSVQGQENYAQVPFRG